MGVRTLTIPAFLILSLVLAGCHGDECLSPGELHESGTRRIHAVDTAFVFQDAQHPTVSQFGSKEYDGNFAVYYRDPWEQGSEFRTVAPRAIDLTFMTVYTLEALRNWKEEGFFNGPTYEGHAAGYFLHEITLRPESLSAGTYPVRLDDTASAARARVRLQIRGGASGGTVWEGNVLSMTALTGSITITEAFTKNSGKLSYTLEATYLPGQKSTFQGTVTFDGYRSESECTYPTGP